MKKVLIIAAHRRNRAPGQRFRFEQFYDFLESNGFKIDDSPIVSEKDDLVLYSKGHYFSKFIIVIRSILKRWKDLKKAHNYDVILIYREALFIGSLFFEKGFKKSKAKIIYDFDDSIWLGDTSNANKKLRWLKRPDKMIQILALSDMVFAGNKFLAGFAAPYNMNVKIIPTTIDTDEYKRVEVSKKDDRICIGWTGSITTIKHFEFAVGFLKKLKKTFGSRIYFKLIGDSSYYNKELNIQGQEWKKENEISELSTFDIGIMPLPDDEWAKGKCGLKGLQYMALEIPAIMSPVGVNYEIIQDGINGYLAESDDEWVRKLSHLIENKEFRIRMGKEARNTVVLKYSKKANQSLYLKCFNELMSSPITQYP